MEAVREAEKQPDGLISQLNTKSRQPEKPEDTKMSVRPTSQSNTESNTTSCIGSDGESNLTEYSKDGNDGKQPNSPTGQLNTEQRQSEEPEDARPKYPSPEFAEYIKQFVQLKPLPDGIVPKFSLEGRFMGIGPPDGLEKLEQRLARSKQLAPKPKYLATLDDIWDASLLAPHYERITCDVSQSSYRSRYRASRDEPSKTNSRSAPNINSFGKTTSESQPVQEMLNRRLQASLAKTRLQASVANRDPNMAALASGTFSFAEASNNAPMSRKGKERATFNPAVADFHPANPPPAQVIRAGCGKTRVYDGHTYFITRETLSVHLAMANSYLELCDIHEDRDAWFGGEATVMFLKAKGHEFAAEDIEVPRHMKFYDRLPFQKQQEREWGHRMNLIKLGEMMWALANNKRDLLPEALGGREEGDHRTAYEVVRDFGNGCRDYETGIMETEQAGPSRGNRLVIRRRDDTSMPCPCTGFMEGL